MIKKICASIICLSVLGCATRPNPAPIENMTNIPNYVQPVTTPTTLTANSTVAAPSPTPAPQMAALDNKSSEAPVTETPTSPAPVSKKKKISSAAVAATTATLVAADTGGKGEWVMPTSGKTTGFEKSSKGIDIFGTQGQTINAINDGKVVYSGNGLKGYGNLIIIKHSNAYLSAYAHNKVNLVKEGASVKRGQKIAEMGTDDSGKALLHLEVRKNGKPVDPLSVIKG